MAPRPSLRDRSGVALPTAIFAMVMIAILVAGIWVSVDVSAKSTGNHQESIRAVQLAEAGAAHGLALLRNELADTTYTRILQGDDAVPETADDGYLVGFGIDAAVEIPASGVDLGDGTYYVQVVNDPADPTTDVLDTNEKVILRCTGETDDGGSATIDALVGILSPTDPAVEVDGGFVVSGNPEITGSCGGIHSNQDLEVSGNVVVEEFVSAAGTVDVKGPGIRDPDGNEIEPESGADARSIPDHSDPTTTHCGNADYELLANGRVRVVATGTEYDARDDEKFGWKRSGTEPVLWDYSGNEVNPGTFCVHGNATLSGSPGGATGVPVSMSIIANGSIEISGNPLLVADDEEGVLFMAGGDVKISGTPVGSVKNYAGFIYAREQCDISGTPRISSQLQCKDLPTASGNKDLIDENSISGDVELEYDCSNGAGGESRTILHWSRRFES